MWTVIHIVPNEKKAKIIQDKLMAEGFLVKITPVSKRDENSYYEILVPGGEVEEAHSILVENDYL
ncbi:hypothetical protein NSA47_09195 [Irregularibacter muris]|uniref:Glutamate decarboxylase n=1 Tax=Irregularibacter muris TaxID=1796619 RepID=A0AAE3HHE3_9FIRM|nr:hypothetical protein [Irregularibacter muris]MCR1899158.1 hypothetical protein [Irregularibacter muris]